MATYYWVGGSGTWDGTSTARWSTTSGGAGGAGVPTSADDARFDALGGTGTVTIASGATCKILTWISTTLTMGGSADFTIYRTFDIEPGVTITYSGTMTVSYGFATIFIAGTPIPFNVNFVSTGSGNWSPSYHNPVFSGTVTLTSGTLDLAGFSMIVGIFSSSNSNTRNITFGGGSLSVVSLFDVSTSTNFTTDLTGYIYMGSGSASPKTFAGGGASYPTLQNVGIGTFTISGSNTFVNIIDNVIFAPRTIKFTSGTTQTITSNFNVSGSNPIVIVTIGATTPGSTAYLSKSSGTVNVAYCNISDSVATGGASWKALKSSGNINSGNNIGWVFTTVAGKFFQLF